MVVCPLPQNYSSPIEYQYYLITTQGVPLTPPPNPPPPKKKNNKKKNKKKKKKKDPGKKRKKGSYLCESSLGGLACWRAFIGKRLVRRGLQQQYLIRCSNLVEYMNARNIKYVAIVYVIYIMNIAFNYIGFINL